MLLTLFLEKSVCVVLGIKNLLLTTGSQPWYQHLQCLFINSYSLSISYVLGPPLGPADAMVNNDNSPATGKPSLVVSKAYETGNSLAVQWLRLHTFISEGTGSIPGWRTKILKAVQCSQEKKKACETDQNQNHGTSCPGWRVYNVLIVKLCALAACLRQPVVVLIWWTRSPWFSKFIPVSISSESSLVCIIFTSWKMP